MQWAKPEVGRKRNRQTPRAGGQALGFAAVRRNQPQMRGKRMVLVEEAAVTHIKGIIEFVSTGLLGRSIGGRKRNGRAVWLPRELLN